MDGGMLAVILTVLVVVVLFSFLRGRGGEKRRPESIQMVLYDVRINQVLVETFHSREKPKKLERNNWILNKDRIGFLDDSLKGALKTTFSMVEEVNEDIKHAKKTKASHKSINVDKLVEPLAECRKGLEDWMMENVGTTQLSLRQSSLIDMLFGGH